MRLITAIALTLMFHACQANCERYETEVYSEPPLGKLMNSEIQSRFYKTLEQWKEPSLEALESEAYRLFVVRSFESDTNHIIRIEKNGLEIRLIHKQSVSPVDSIIIVFDKKEKTLSQDQWEKFEKMVYDANYWTLPVEIDRIGFDGSLWDIEGVRPDAARCDKRIHHGVSRWSPEKGTYRDLCEAFFELSEN